MDDPFIKHLPKPAYLRLLAYQKGEKVDSYQADWPLVLFISLSRIAAGLALIYIFFPESALWSGVSLGSMIVATLASITHLAAPRRFLTMAINNRSCLTWEIRLAGALGSFLGLQLLAWLPLPWPEWLLPWRLYLPWVNASLSLLFLFSTGWAYRFETHPAWRSALLPFYYLASALAVGLGLRSIQSPSPATPFFFAGLMLGKSLFLAFYRNHLKTTSPAFLRGIVSGKERGVFLAFLWTDLFLPVLLTLVLFSIGRPILYSLFTASCLAGIFLERILFFWLEKPVFFLSFMENPESHVKHSYWIRG